MSNVARKFIEEGKIKGIAEGKAEGIAEGETKAKLAVAKSMLEEGSDIQFIIKVTGLSEADINKLK